MRAQLSTDFLIVCLTLALIFSLAYALYVQNASSQLSASHRLSAARIAEKVARAANFVLADGTGSSVTVYLEPMGELNYSLEFIERRVQLTWPISATNQTISYPILTSAIRGAGVRYAGQNITLVNEGGDLRVA
ncbi:MAG: hypothetical protein QXG98_03120 [Candidatus Micrarchaeia archaeon]